MLSFISFASCIFLPQLAFRGVDALSGNSVPGSRGVLNAFNNKEAS